MALLALDLGTTTGWALGSSPIMSGTASFKPQRYEGGGMRFLRFVRWLDELNETSTVTLQGKVINRVMFEEVRRHNSTDAAHVYGGLMASLTSWCEERKVAYMGVPVGTIKKHATGKGNANKLAMINAAIARGYAPADDNEADALCLLHYGIDWEAGKG